MPPEDVPTETSPLLGDSANGVVKSVDGFLPDGPIANGSAHGQDEERREEVDGAREAQFEGMPEVRKNLKYILPAIAIGVSI